MVHKICHLAMIFWLVFAIKLNMFKCAIRPDDLVFSNSISENSEEYSSRATKDNSPSYFHGLSQNEQAKLKAINTNTKIRLMEIYLNELMRQELINDLASSIHKNQQFEIQEQQQQQQPEFAAFDSEIFNQNPSSSFQSNLQATLDKRNDLNKAIFYKKRMRSMNDKKRPGWELAYGRRKRSIKL